MPNAGPSSAIRRVHVADRDAWHRLTEQGREQEGEGRDGGPGGLVEPVRQRTLVDEPRDDVSSAHIRVVGRHRHPGVARSRPRGPVVADDAAGILLRRGAEHAEPRRAVSDGAGPERCLLVP